VVQHNNLKLTLSDIKPISTIVDSLMDLSLSVTRYPLPCSGRSYSVITMSTAYQPSIYASTLASTTDDTLPPYSTYPTKDQVWAPSIDGAFTIYGINTVYQLNIPTPYGIETTHYVYQQRQLEVHSKDQPPTLLGLIWFGELKIDIILTGIELRLVHTWIPRTLN
jgi:hypothetical protein